MRQNRYWIGSLSGFCWQAYMNNLAMRLAPGDALSSIAFVESDLRRGAVWKKLKGLKL